MGQTRILALDPGTKRIGVALSDEMGWIAQPLETFERRSLEADVSRIQMLVDRHGVCEVVVGLPLRSDGSIGPEAEGVQRFVERLGQNLPAPVVAWDERFTSKLAEGILIGANVSRKKRKGAVDRMAAAILLQSYLEARSSAGDSSGGPTGGDREDHAFWDGA
jgi:putative Holliday junction resolvase